MAPRDGDLHGRYALVAELAGHLHEVAVSNSSDAVDALLCELTDRISGVLPQAEHTGIMLWTKDTRYDRERRLTPAASGDTVAATLDKLQVSHAEGPSIDAAQRCQTINVTDLATDDRWPTLLAAVRGDVPARSVLSAALRHGDTALGAVTLSSDSPAAFVADDMEIATTLAVHASVAVSTARAREQWLRAVETRDTIGQAKGMLMERYRIDADAAFDLLRRLSQDTNTPVIDLAEQVVRAEAADADSVR